MPASLAKVIHVAATFGMVVGSELHERAVLPKDHYIIQAFINSAVRYISVALCVYLCFTYLLLSHTPNKYGVYFATKDIVCCS